MVSPMLSLSNRSMLECIGWACLGGYKPGPVGFDLDESLGLGRAGVFEEEKRRHRRGVRGEEDIGEARHMQDAARG